MHFSNHMRTVALAAAGLVVAGCFAARSGSPPASAPAPARLQDQRHFTVAESELPFVALPEPSVATDRWWGVEGGAGYRIEVPERWNGRLVMYAHGFRGEVEALTPAEPRIRRQLLEAGYAWAASTYSANAYDVRAGVEDTNALAGAFTRIARARGRALPEPHRIYITGHSMGGHVAAAAVEAVTLATARHRLRYAGALPMCGVLGDLELMDYYGAYALAAQQLAGAAPAGLPLDGLGERTPVLIGRLFSSFPSAAAPAAPIVLRDTTEAQRLKAIVMNLSGGPRPVFDEGFARASNGYAWSVFPVINNGDGILPRRSVTTEHTLYRFASSAALTPEEVAFNRTIPRAQPDPDPNPAQPGALRYIPRLDGDVHVPVLTLHNLGDLFVPFSMEQIYRRRIEAHGNGRWLVQRAIRSPLHCDFTEAEEAAAFEALVAWSEHGARPAGDDVLTPARLADPAYGCQFTDDHAQPGERAIGALRALMPRCPAGVGQSQQRAAR